MQEESVLKNLLVNGNDLVSIHFFIIHALPLLFGQSLYLNKFYAFSVLFQATICNYFQSQVTMVTIFFEKKKGPKKPQLFLHFCDFFCLESFFKNLNNKGRCLCVCLCLGCYTISNHVSQRFEI